VKESLLVIKVGGNVIDNPLACQAFLERFSKLPQAKILIHGGGKIATQIAEKLDIETVMIDGRRITNQATLDVVTMVYGGLINKKLVATLQSLDVNAIGLTGADAGIIRATKRPVKSIDYGFVGDITAIDDKNLTFFLTHGLTPIIAPLSFDASLASMLNTNADTMASAIAVALAAHFEVNLVYCFEKKGVLSNPNNDESVIAALNPAQYDAYKTAGVVNKGMIPKLDNAFAAICAGVSQVTICHAQDLTEAINEQSQGTRLCL
jgi:acetylglutamate kinase